MLTIKEMYKKYIVDKKLSGILIMAAAGILLLCIASWGGTDQKKPQELPEVFDIFSYKHDCEKKLKTFLEKIDGVESAEVMISFADYGSRSYGYNSKNSDSENSSSSDSEIAFRRSNGDEIPVEEKMNLPEIKGVTVVADGNCQVKIPLIRAIKSALGAEIHNIEVIINERN